MAGTRLVREVGSATEPGTVRIAAATIATTTGAEPERTFAPWPHLTQSTRIHNRVATGGFDWSGDAQSVVLPDAQGVGPLAAIGDGQPW